MALSVMPFIGRSCWKREGNKIRGTFGGTKRVRKTPALHSLSYSPFHPSPLRPLFPCAVLLIFGQSFCIHEVEIEMEMRAGWVKQSEQPQQWPRPNEAPSAARRTTTAQPTRVRDRGDSAATIQPLIPPDYQPLTSITASGKQCIKRPQQGRWKITDSAGVECVEGVEWGREGGSEGGNLVPFYLHRARRLVTFTR